MKLGLLALALLASLNLVACGGEAPPPGVRVGQRIQIKFPSGEGWTGGDVTEVNGWMVKIEQRGWVNLREAASWRELPVVTPDHSQPSGVDIQIVNKLKEKGKAATPEAVNQVRAGMGLGPTTWTGYKTE